MEVRDLFLVTQRKAFEDVEPIWLLRWLLRRYFKWRGFACRSHICNNEDGRHGNGKTIQCPKCAAPVIILCDGKCYASIEYRGAVDDEATARWASNCQGGSFTPIPFNVVLPEETVTYKQGDVPQSEASPWYRRGVMLPFIAIERSQFEKLDAKTQQVLDCAEGKREAKAV